jgi:voltage-gated potassium channel
MPISTYIRETHERKKNLWRNNIILFFGLITLIFLAPLLHRPGELGLRLILGIVVISGIFAAEFSKRVFGILLILGGLVVSTMVLGIALPNVRSIQIVAFLLLTASLILSTTALVSHVAGSRSVEKSTILCAINSYMLIGLTGSVLFIIVDLIVPHSFVSIQSGTGELNGYIYFGFVTLTTLGYGDIAPQAPLARSLSTFVAMAGQLYLVIIMALIIGKYLNSKNR